MNLSLSSLMRSKAACYWKQYMSSKNEQLNKTARGPMKNIIAVILLVMSFNVIAYDRNDTRQNNSYNPNSYGSPQLYYSAESIRERQELELLNESNRIAKERLEVEREQLQKDKREHGTYGE